MSDFHIIFFTTAKLSFTFLNNFFAFNHRELFAFNRSGFYNFEQLFAVQRFQDQITQKIFKNIYQNIYQNIYNWLNQIIIGKRKKLYFSFQPKSRLDLILPWSFFSQVNFIVFQGIMWRKSTRIRNWIMWRYPEIFSGTFPGPSAPQCRLAPVIRPSLNRFPAPQILLENCSTLQLLQIKKSPYLLGISTISLVRTKLNPSAKQSPSQRVIFKIFKSKKIFIKMFHSPAILISFKRTIFRERIC